MLGGVTFLTFGAVLLGPALEHVTWQEALYAVLSLTVVRMLPVAIGMIGSGATWRTVGFLGWFGPRGLASIVFAVIAVEEAHLPGANTILIDGVPDRRPIGVRARNHRGPARARLRGLVRVASAAAPSGDGERSDAGTPDAGASSRRDELRSQDANPHRASHGPTPHPESLLVLYLGDAAGGANSRGPPCHRARRSANPYWAEHRPGRVPRRPRTRTLADVARLTAVYVNRDRCGPGEGPRGHWTETLRQRTEERGE